MATYEWTQDRTNSQFSLGNPPPWWTTDGLPVLVATVPSPVGEGDTLVRTELWASAGAWWEGNSFGPLQPSELFGVVIKLMGEVYVSGASGLPDPDALGVASAVITAAAPTTTMAYDSTIEPGRGGVTMSTAGVVTSKGERGPAKYGSGHPELRVGMVGENVLDPDVPGSFNSRWNIWVRCLWRVP